ncbi:unnamed protein product [Blepharisma stoltei]|uniref:Uncharacterized protein n=1 Tax=Blepharisma stoltei TaxID=1481888 RepID=A0AAU9KD70_9CILI|nr:unnamed protein product [Blepharisma stoltei]
MGCNNSKVNNRRNQRVFIIKSIPSRIVAPVIEKKKSKNSNKEFVSDIIKLHSVEVSFAMIDKNHEHTQEEKFKNERKGHKRIGSLIMRDIDQAIDSVTMSIGKTEV